MTKTPKPTKSTKTKAPKAKTSEPFIAPTRLYSLDPSTKLDPKEIAAMTVRVSYEGHGASMSIITVYFKGGAVLFFHVSGPDHEIRARQRMLQLEALA